MTSNGLYGKILEINGNHQQVFCFAIILMFLFLNHSDLEWGIKITGYTGSKFKPYSNCEFNVDTFYYFNTEHCCNFIIKTTNDNLIRSAAKVSSIIG